MGAAKTGGQIVGYCVGVGHTRCGRPLAARKYCQQLGVHENHGGMRCPSCARMHRLGEQHRRGYGTGAMDGRVKVYPPPGPWVFDAACAQVDLELHFPAKGDSNRPAKLVCQGCPVIAECADYALDNAVSDGVWGGLSTRDRERLLQERRAA